MGIADRTALTPRLLDPATWKGTDDDNRWMRWRITLKHWFAFSHRSPQGVAFSFVFLPLYWISVPILIIPLLRKWRKIPMVVVGVRGDGVWRFEDNHSQMAGNELDNFLWWRRPEVNGGGNYLSRIQPWCRWHVALHWPWLITFHWYWKAHDVLPAMTNAPTDGEVFSAYRGWHYDTDETFWGDGGGAGNFK